MTVNRSCNRIDDKSIPFGEPRAYRVSLSPKKSDFYEFGIVMHDLTSWFSLYGLVRSGGGCRLYEPIGRGEPIESRRRRSSPFVTPVFLRQVKH